MDVLDTLEVLEFNSNDELMEDPKGDLELVEHQPNHDVEDAELGTSDNSFDSGEELVEDSDPDYDPSRDH